MSFLVRAGKGVDINVMQLVLNGEKTMKQNTL